MIRYFSLIAISLSVLTCGRAEAQQPQPWITGYYVDTTLPMSDIPWSKMTHAVHFKIKPSDGSGNLTGIPGENADAFTAAAHAAGVKALVCLGDNEGNVSTMTTSMSNHLYDYVNNVVNFVNAHGYDGVDVDWETGSFGKDPDKTNYINFLNALKNALGPGRILTVAGFWNSGLESVFQAAAGSLSQVNIMCYDMDQWNPKLYYNDATYRAPGDTENDSCAAQAAQFASYIPAAKIGLGIPFYGRMWSGANQLMQPKSGASQSFMPYKDLVASPYWSMPHWWDTARGASFITVSGGDPSGAKLITFTGVEQINEIVKLGRASGYGGYMLFEVEYDLDAAASGDARHPLATATHRMVNTPPQ